MLILALTIQCTQLVMAPARTIDLPISGEDARLQSRTNIWDSPTSGIAPGYLQANLLVLPSSYARDFALLCARNPVPCPLLASSASPGDFQHFESHIQGIYDHQIAKGLDIRNDIPRYTLYNNGELQKTALSSIEPFWDERDSVAFLIGCSFSFENALTKADLPPPHMLHGRNVPMYRTNIPLAPAGAFTGSTFVVSMRLYRRSEVERVRDTTRPYVATHGEPIAWGWDAMRAIGIAALNNVDWGDTPVTADGLQVDESGEIQKQDGLLPVFWACGVTPQLAVMNAKIPGIVMGHQPGYMVVLDVKEHEVLTSIC